MSLCGWSQDELDDAAVLLGLSTNQDIGETDADDWFASVLLGLEDTTDWDDNACKLLCLPKRHITEYFDISEGDPAGEQHDTDLSDLWLESSDANNTLVDSYATVINFDDKSVEGSSTVGRIPFLTVTPRPILTGWVENC